MYTHLEEAAGVGEHLREDGASPQLVRLALVAAHRLGVYLVMSGRFSLVWIGLADDVHIHTTDMANKSTHTHQRREARGAHHAPALQEHHQVADKAVATAAAATVDGEEALRAGDAGPGAVQHLFFCVLGWCVGGT